MGTQTLLIGVGGIFIAHATGWLTFRVVSSLAFIMIALVLSLIMNQESMLYVPVIQGIKTPSQNPPHLQNPERMGMRYTEHWLPVKGETGLELHAWFLPAAEEPSSAPTILFCHENAGNIGLRLDEFRENHGRLGVNQLVFDYRGFGASKGAQPPSEQGLVADARTALGFLGELSAQGVIDGSKIILAGRSLGGAVVAQVAGAPMDELLKKHEIKVAGVIIENTFTCIEDMVDHMFPFLSPLGPLKQKFLRLRWRSIDVFGKISLPLLLLSSDKDEIVPAGHMHTLKAAATGAEFCEMHTFPQATHNDIFQAGGQKFWDAKRNFIKKVTAS